MRPARRELRTTLTPVSCGKCGAAVRPNATYCEMCGTRVAELRAAGSRQGLTGTAVIIIVAAAMTAIAIIGGLAVLVRSLLT